MNQQIVDKFRNIRLIAYDFDGVMTDNRVILDQNGRESVIVNRGDGYGIARIKELGIQQVIISTEVNPVVACRAEKLKVEVIHGVDDKQSIVKEYCSKFEISLEHVLFIGNDINDFEAMKCVGLRGCPSDAESEILEIAEWVSKAKGGYGVCRELYRVLINTKIF